MELNEILQDIATGLTGNYREDLSYLENQCIKYRNHPLEKEIIRACRKIIYDISPDNRKKSTEKILDINAASLDAKLKELRFYMFKGDIKKALKLSEALIEEMEKSASYQNDLLSGCFAFDTPFEELVYCLYNPEKKTKQVTFPYGEIYYIHGSMLFELNKIMEAREYLEKALKWNPVSCIYSFEYIETFKATGEIEKFFELTKEYWKYTFVSDIVARCYRNFGYYFIEKKDYTTAKICYNNSLNYAKDNIFAQSQLYYIDATATETLPDISEELINQCKEKYNLPMGANSDLIELAETCVLSALKQKNDEAALYFIAIYSGIADKKDSEKLIREVEEMVFKNKE